MKIGEIKKGMIVGIVDEKPGWGDLPRRAEVIDIVAVEETQWTGRGYSSTRRTVKRRYARVRMLDGSLKSSAEKKGWGSSRKTVVNANKGAKLNVKPTQVVSEWDALRKDVEKKITAIQVEADLLATTEARLKNLGLGRKARGAFAYASTHTTFQNNTYVEFRVSGTDAERVLMLAEKGLVQEKLDKGARG